MLGQKKMGKQSRQSGESPGKCKTIMLERHVTVRTQSDVRKVCQHINLWCTCHCGFYGKPSIFPREMLMFHQSFQENIPKYQSSQLDLSMAPYLQRDMYVCIYMMIYDIYIYDISYIYIYIYDI